MEEDPDAYLKLPLEERSIHKLWKARVSGYEEAVKKFNSMDGDDPSWKKYLGQTKKYITDTNAIAQEKGLEAALALVENCDSAGKITGECTDGLVSKCIGAPKAKTKEMAGRIILAFVEIEQQEKVVDELLKGLGQKNPKVVSGCVGNLAGCLRAFGAKVMKVSPLLKAVVPLLDHRDKVVREEGKQLIVEAYRWVGDVMKSQLAGLKPVQLSELEAEFETAKGGPKAKPERLLRSQQGAAAEVGGGGDEPEGGNDGEEEEEAGADDPYDLIEGVNILPKIPSDFCAKVEEKKWQLRGEALDALLPLAQTPKIEPGDYGDVARALKKLISKDTNVMLVAKAAQCVAGLAKGLRGAFKQHAAHLLPVVLDKFKEKKPAVVAALAEAADGLLQACLSVEAAQDDCLAAFKHKTPGVTVETAKLLARSFAFCPPSLVSNKKMVKGYVCALAEKLNHSDPVVRESASETLGVLVKVLGENAIMKLMPDLEAIKVAKIKECAEKAELKGKLPKVAPPAQKSAEPEANKGAKVVKPKQPTKKASTASAPSSAASSSSAQRKVSAANRPTAPPPTTRKKDDFDPSPPYAVNDLKKARFKDETRLKLLKWNFVSPRQEFVDQLQEQVEAAGFNATLQTQMFHKDFRQHLKAIDVLSKVLDSEGVAGLASNLDLVLKWLTLRFFETNPSVLIRGLEYLQSAFGALAGASYVMHDLEASSFVPYLVQKAGDPKDPVRNSVRAILKGVCQVHPASKVSPYLMEGLRHKNAKLRTVCLDEIGTMVKHHGVGVLPNPGSCMKEIAKSIADRDNSVRSAALNAVAEAYFQLGEKAYKMVGSLPEKDMAMLEERIKRVAKTRQPLTSNGQQEAPPVPHAKEESMPPPPPAAAATAGQHKSALPTTASRIKNFRQFPVPGGGPSPNIPPPVLASDTKRSPGGGRDRPVSGAFTLDLDKIENAGASSAVGGDRNVSLRLVNHDLEDILNGVPVVLPTRRQAASPPPPPSKNLQESVEAKEALDVVLAQVFSTEPQTCLSALSQLQELLKDRDKSQALMAGRAADQLLQACYMQYRNVLSAAVEPSSSTMTTRLLQSVTMVLMVMYQDERIARRASMGPLRDLVHVVVTVLLDPRVQRLPNPDGEQLLKALNLLTVKILDRSDPTAVTSAVVRILHDGLGSQSPKFVELAMKCLWKVMRHLPRWLEAGDVDVDVVLLDVHNFMKKYPSAHWKKQESDTPIRSVKTLVHTVVKAKGDSVLDHLSKIDEPQSSEMVVYLKKLLNSGVGGKENQASAGAAVAAVGRFSKSDHETLADIFKKIGQKEQTKQGLQELKAFKQQNPQADIEPFLAKSSQYFRNYIERGLASVDGDQPPTSSLGVRVLSEARDANDVFASGSSSVFLEKLKVLRERGGLDKKVTMTTTTTTTGGSRVGISSGGTADIYRISSFSSNRAEEEGEHTTPAFASQPSTTSATDVEDIRRRLERVKNSAF